MEILPEEKEKLSEFFIPVSAFDSSGICDIQNKIIHGDTFQALPHLPEKFADLLFLDPPYNLTKDFDGEIFRQRKSVNYEKWFSDIFEKLLPLLKPEASVYVCADWKSSCEIYNVISKHLTVRNRITWEREKGRGSLTNWKNCSEDIWFATVSNKYKFHPERVKLKRRVIAPYKENGKPKDWEDNESGKFRLTFPSNFWNDITVPFWSMSENTDHPTQKPEKLLAKLILASTEPGDTVFDPFLGSGSSAVTAKKLGRNYTGIESQINYCLFAAKRLKMAELDPSIQGYNGVFKERNAKE
ncbi:MAG: DNA methyltransferase [Spirochaetia bacterium]|nr:DNA methyltransferase [Spirochaetia bacterium]